MLEKDRIESLEDLCNYFHADEPSMLNKILFKYTQCGASISVQISPVDPDVYMGEPTGWDAPFWIHNDDQAWQYLTTDHRMVAFTIQTIVEGSDATVDSNPFVLPVDKEEVEKWMDYMEGEAEYLWREANQEDYWDYDEEV
jgi:hypothetical protein